MNKAEIVDQLVKEHPISKNQAESLLNSTMEIIKKSVKKGEVVTLVGFGSFFKAKRKARKGRNPQTGNELKIPAHSIPKFRPGREFKKAVK
ncbi:MAG: HU family DNA-binding protein [Bacteriovoracia bacterium]